MTGKLLPFAHPAPRRAEPETPVRDRNPADDLAISLEIDIDELARAIVRETDHLETDPRSKRPQ